MQLEWYLARKYFKSKRKESFIAFMSWLSLIGIALGVAVLIIVMSVMNGFRKEIITNILGADGHIMINNYQHKITNYTALINKINHNPQILYVAPTITEQVMLMSNERAQGAILKGITLNDLKKREVFWQNLQQYNFENFDTEVNQLIIGRVLARKLAVQVGDSISVLSSNGLSTAFGSMPRIGYFKIFAILNTGMYQYDSSLVILPFHAASYFLDFTSGASQNIEVFVKQPNNVATTKQAIQNIVGNRYYVSSWQDNNHFLIDALIVERNVMFLILSLIVVIAAFNILSGLMMLVKSKTKEIAILQTLGLSTKSIILIFFLIGLRIGIIGIVSGSIIGILFSYNIEHIRRFLEYLIGYNLFSEEIYFLTKLPVDIHPLQITGIIILALLFVILSSIYPAIISSKIKPINALKYE